MKILKIILSIFSISLICSINPLKEYTSEYYMTANIGEYYDIQMLLTTDSIDTILFNNMDRKLYTELEGKKEYKSGVELATNRIPEFKFEVKEDKTEVNNQNVQGIIGLGNNEGKNKLLDAFKKAEVLEKRVVFLDFKSMHSKIQFINDYPKVDDKLFSKCKMASKKGLNDAFQEMWITDFTHFYLPNILSGNVDSLTLNEIKEVNSKAAFDLKSNYITAPKSQMETFEQFFSNSGIECHSFSENEFTYFNCEFPTGSANSISPIYFLFNGYLLQVKADSLFTNLATTSYTCLIRFMDGLDNAWVFGYPIFNSYEIRLDFDENTIGFKGGKIKDMQEEYSSWKLEKMKDNLVSNPIFWGVVAGVIVLIGIIIAAILLRNRCLKKKEANLVENEQNNENP